MSQTCTEIVARLSEPGAAEAPAVRAHLEGCPGCRQAASALELLARTAQSPSPQRLAHFATRVRAAERRAAEARQRRAPWRTGLVAGALATAGAAAVALLLARPPALPPAGLVEADPAAAWWDGAAEEAALSLEGEEAELALLDEDDFDGAI